MIETRGLENHKRGWSRQRRAMKKYIDIFPKLTRISRAGWNESRVVSSIIFYDGSMIIISGRVQVFKIFKLMSARPDAFKMTFSKFEFVYFLSKQGLRDLVRMILDLRGACLLSSWERVELLQSTRSESVEGEWVKKKECHDRIQ